MKAENRSLRPNIRTRPVLSARARGRARRARCSRRARGSARAPRAASRGRGRALLAARGEAPEGGPADQHRVGAEGERDGDVDAAADAAVDQDRGPAVDRVDDLRQRVGGGQAAVELAAAVVGDDDAGGAVLDRQLGVLGGEQALDAAPARCIRRRGRRGRPRSSAWFISAKVSSIVSALGAAESPRSGSGTPSSGGSVKPVAAVALAVAAGRRVDGDEDRLEAGRRPPRRSAPGSRRRP